MILQQAALHFTLTQAERLNIFRAMLSQDRPTVLHLVCGMDPRGGTASYVRHVSSQNIEGFDQRVWRHRDYKPENSLYVCRGWARKTEVNAATDVLGAFLDFLPLWFWLRKHPSVILHAHTRMGTVLAVLMSAVRKIPVVIHLHVRWRQINFHKRLWRMARAKVIFNSKGTCLHFGCPPESSEILMPTMAWPEAPLPGASRCVSASLIVPHKNVHLIVEAYNNTPPPAKSSLHVYGFSPALGDPVYEKRVASLAKPNPRVHLHDWNPKWTTDLGTSDVFVHAWQEEPFGIVLLEAYAKGCRIVVPYGSFLEDLPPDGIFPAKLTVNDFSSKIELAQVYEPPKNLWQIRQSVAGLFSVKNTAQRLSAIYAVTAEDLP
jgi:hypothetical protein